MAKPAQTYQQKTPQRVEFRVVEADGKPYPPGQFELQSRAAAELRLKHYESIVRVSGEGRMPKKPMSIEWRTVDVGPWNGQSSGLDLVEPLELADACKDHDSASDLLAGSPAEKLAEARAEYERMYERTEGSEA